MQHWRVLLDLDGTVTENAGRRVAARHFDIQLSEADHDRSLLEILGVSEATFWRWWEENHEEIYGEAVPIPGAIDQVQALKRAGAHIAVVTARRASARLVTERWLAHARIPYDEIFFSADDKVSIALDRSLNVGFEDDLENTLALAEHMPMFLIAHRNKNGMTVSHPRVYPVGTWDDVPPLMERLVPKSA